MKTFALVLFLSSFHFAIAADNCLQKRAAFDVGSGTTKMVVAEVNHCERKIVKILGSEQEAVEYKRDLTEMGNNRFSSEIQTKGSEVLSTFKKKAKELGATQFSGVATSAFRQAQNGEPYLARITKELGINMRLVSQAEEGILGYWAARSILLKEGVEVKDPVVWDIGGGSQQIVAQVKKGKKDDWVVSANQFGSVPFKEAIVNDILKKDPKKVSSPNPLNAAQVEQALKMARDSARGSVLDKFKKQVAESELIGIGGVLSISVRKQAGVDSVFTQEQVRETLKKQTGKTDQDIGGEYAATEVSNLILVLGFMEELKINKVRTVKGNLADGILIDPKFWDTK